jgi:hypothetical protein
MIGIDGDADVVLAEVEGELAATPSGSQLFSGLFPTISY